MVFECGMFYKERLRWIFKYEDCKRRFKYEDLRMGSWRKEFRGGYAKRGSEEGNRKKWVWKWALKRRSDDENFKKRFRRGK